MDRKKIVKASIWMIIIVVLIGGYYYYLSTRNEKANSIKATEEKITEEMTPVQELLAMSKYKEYPTTPVQVVKYYNEITSCFYNESYSEDELEKLALLSRTLLDPELVANQSDDDYLSSLKDQIEIFKTGNITIYSSQLTPSTDVEYFEHNGDTCAKLYCMYTLKSGTFYQSSREVYILRKDIEGHWRIFGFDMAVDSENN